MTLPDTPPIIVIGMHRSGTSLLAELLSDLGAHMGKELDIHHEALCFKDTNKDLLALTGAHWAKPGPFLSALATAGFVARCRDFADACLERRLAGYGEVGQAPAWGWKDPRNTLTLPIWLERFPRAKVIHIVRDGLDVALSMHRRELRRWVNKSDEKRMFPPTLGACHRLWKQYVSLGRDHERRHHPTLALRYEDLLANQEEELIKIAAFASIAIDGRKARRIAGQRIGRPTARNRGESLRLRCLLRLGLLDKTDNLFPEPPAPEASVRCYRIS